jgi:hypothetical protein
MLSMRPLSPKLFFLTAGVQSIAIGRSTKAIKGTVTVFP